MRHRIDLPEPVWRLVREACTRQRRTAGQVVAALLVVWAAELSDEDRAALRDWARPGRRPLRRTT